MEIGKSLHVVFVAASLFSVPAYAQSDGSSKDYPTRAVRIVAPAQPGGGADLISRLIALALNKSLGQPFIVENRPGASNIIATEVVAKAPPDGYTLLMATTGTFVTNPLIFSKLSYSDRDFAPISNVVNAAFILSVNPAVPAQSLGELVALAKKRPGQLTYASFGRGSSTNLAGELFQFMTGTKLLHVPYKGGAPGMADLIAGQIVMTFDSAQASMGNIHAKKIRPLGVTSLKRLALLPDVPTFDEFGLKGYEAGSWYGIMAPAGTPAPIINRLHSEIVKAVQLPEVNKRFTEWGVEVVANTPEEFAAQIQKERARWAKVVHDAGINPE
jgi:tripartite-type tricarboxylate transporter receptor subunit TctC